MDAVSLSMLSSMGCTTMVRDIMIIMATRFLASPTVSNPDIFSDDAMVRFWDSLELVGHEMNDDLVPAWPTGAPTLFVYSRLVALVDRFIHPNKKPVPLPVVAAAAAARGSGGGGGGGSSSSDAKSISKGVNDLIRDLKSIADQEGSKWMPPSADAKITSSVYPGMNSRIIQALKTINVVTIGDIRSIIIAKMGVESVMDWGRSLSLLEGECRTLNTLCMLLRSRE